MELKINKVDKSCANARKCDKILNNAKCVQFVKCDKSINIQLFFYREEPCKGMPLDDYTIKSYAEKFGSEICCSIVKKLDLSGACASLLRDFVLAKGTD